MKTSNRFIFSLFLMGTILVLLAACNFKDRDNTSDTPEHYELAQKALIDSSKILRKLELYRAPRFESIQEARSAGPANVHKIILYAKNLDHLSPEIGQFAYLASLDIAFNGLTDLPAEISELHYLQGFYANGNSLSEFPDEIILLPLLEKVDLSENQIASIPLVINRMGQLTRLSMDQNTLSRIPVQLYELENLSILELAHNGLSKVPEGISNLTMLKKLDLSYNQIKSLPREIASLTGTLEELNIQGNLIPQAEINWLKEAMPDTRIRY